jgi:hypothetical protein
MGTCPNSGRRVDFRNGNSIRDSSEARPEGEGRLPQRALISRSASNLPGLDWQSRGSGRIGPVRETWPGRRVPEAHAVDRAYPKVIFYYPNDSIITHVDLEVSQNHTP